MIERPFCALFSFCFVMIVSALITGSVFKITAVFCLLSGYMAQRQMKMARALCRMLYAPPKFWVFCTGKQVSMCHFHQFYKVTKTNIEIIHLFMYNVTITVFRHRNRKSRGYFHSQIYIFVAVHILFSSVVVYKRAYLFKQLIKGFAHFG